MAFYDINPSSNLGFFMSELQELLTANRAWADKTKTRDPEFFQKLSRQQSPKYLWIGCSDSRVPANEIINLMPGEVFVHRNIANLVIHTDLNCLSVIQYAVDVLKVEHIMVVGHYGCGGVKAAMEASEHGLIDNWLRHIRDVYRMRKNELIGMDETSKQNKLCELNVIEQVNNLCHTTMVQNAWKNGAKLCVHGWVYSLEDGLIRDLDVRRSCLEDLEDLYHLS